MAFLDDLGKTISNKSQNITQKAKDVTEITRLNGQIAGYKSELEKLYSNLGKEFYQKQKNNEEYTGADLIAEINSLHEQISVCYKQIEKLKSNRTCSVCGAPIVDNAMFCNTCGAKQPEQTICSRCGTVITDSESVFCPGCGNKL